MESLDRHLLPLPLQNADGQPYWSAAKEERLSLQRCTKCRTLRFPPGFSCRKCGSSAVEWVDVSGRGKVYSFTIVHRGPTPEFSGLVPYVLALIELEEGPRMMAHIVGADAAQVTIDERVQVVFEKGVGDFKIPQFRREAHGIVSR